MVRGETDKKTNDLQTRHIAARNLERYVRCIKTQRETKVGYRETKARQCQKIAWYLLHWSRWWRIQECCEKYAFRKLEVPMPAAMLCKIPRDMHRETCSSVEKTCKTKYEWTVEADEDTRKRLDGSLHKNHEGHIAGKGINSLSQCNLVRKFIPRLQAMKIPDAKVAVDKKWKKTREDTGMAADDSQNRIRGDRWSKDEGRKSSFRLTDGHLSFEECRIWDKAPKIQRSGCVLRGDTVKDDSGSYAVFTEQGSSASQMTAAKVMDIISRLPGCAGQAADGNISWYTGQHGRCTIFRPVLQPIVDPRTRRSLAKDKRSRETEISWTVTRCRKPAVSSANIYQQANLGHTTSTYPRKAQRAWTRFLRTTRWQRSTWTVLFFFWCPLLFEVQ